ncbi:MAG: ester cyclase [Acidobacteria bacterium]|nr:ester cyclase [Acidobacteriota bacterium]MBI3427313.1 ester cyclase [Acidobacteriota bacterium]
MSVTENKNLVTRYFTALSGQPKPEALVRQYTNDPALLGHVAFFEAAFPRYELFADDLLAEGDKVTVRARFAGVQRGDLMGSAPTGKAVALPFIIIYRIADGLIAEHWMAVDQLDLMKQLGVMPS